MNKKLTTLLLTSSVLALAALQPVGAEGTTNSTGADSTAAPATTKYKEIHYVTFKNSNPVDIKDPLTGDAAAKAGETYPEIAGYRYGSSRPEGDVLYHVYSLIANEQPANNNGSAQTNPYHRDNNTDGNQNNGGSSNQNQTTPNGFKVEGNKTYYYKDGKKVTGFVKVDSKEYYFDNNGEMVKGLLIKDGKQYFLSETDGVRKLGFVKYNDKTYYFFDNGDVKTGFVKVDDKTYYLKDGVRLTGEITVDGKKYFLDDKGVLKPGLVSIDGKVFFVDDNGNRFEGCNKVVGTT